MQIETHEADSMSAIGERLRLLRTVLDLSQGQMAERHGVESQQAWANYERAERPLDYRIALSVAQKDGVSLDWIYRGLVGTLTVDMAEKLSHAKPTRRGRPRRTA
ncbi:XRE family transcriptional regulator [Methylobacterium sp. P1-11]|nr:XRE family transcriptional regulator [Methylobacterium sp. P1-11]